MNEFAPSPDLRRPVFWRWLAGILVIGIAIGSLMPKMPRLPFDDENWVMHAFSYGSVMALLARIHIASRGRFALCVALCLTGVTVEYLQRLTGYRSFDPADMVANSIGVMLGWLLSPPRVPSGLPAIEAMLFKK